MWSGDKTMSKANFHPLSSVAAIDGGHTAKLRANCTTKSSLLSQVIVLWTSHCSIAAQLILTKVSVEQQLLMHTVEI